MLFSLNRLAIDELGHWANAYGGRSPGKPDPARVPTAAVHQSVAAVFIPRMLKPSFRITPPPRIRWRKRRMRLLCPGYHLPQSGRPSLRTWRSRRRPVHSFWAHPFVTFCV